MASSIFLNMSLGLSSSAGVVTFTSPPLFPDGTPGAPGITFANDTLSGFLRSATNIIGVSVGGSTRMAFDSSGTFNQFSLLSSSLAWGGLGNLADVFLQRVAAGQLNLTNGTVGVGFDVVTDAVMKVRTRAQTGYATVDCLGLKASGAAGANFGPAGVVSLTVVNGIVTAAS